jgi:hypothetical protein
VSWAELLPSGPGKPPALGLRERVLCALAEAYVTRRVAIGNCYDCTVLGRMCADHAEDAALADAYEADYMRIRGIGSDGAMLTLIGGLTS